MGAHNVPGRIGGVRIGADRAETHRAGTARSDAVPVEDQQEQQAPVDTAAAEGPRGEPTTSIGLRFDANEADVVEQLAEVPGDDEYPHDR
jgi:hypothetical protein